MFSTAGISILYPCITWKTTFKECRATSWTGWWFFRTGILLRIEGAILFYIIGNTLYHLCKSLSIYHCMSFPLYPCLRKLKRFASLIFRRKRRWITDEAVGEEAPGGQHQSATRFWRLYLEQEELEARRTVGMKVILEEGNFNVYYLFIA